MLVYSNTLWLDKTSGIESVLTAISDWLSFKTHEKVLVWRFKENSERVMGDNSRIESWAASSAFPVLHAIRYTHRDSKVSGRQWVTEIGLKLDDAQSPIQCSILLKTNEISARVSAKVEVTRPRVVESIIKKSSISNETPGLSVTTLTEDNAEAVGTAIHDPKRTHAILVVSPKDDQYLVDVERVRSLVVGLAEVFVIPYDADTFAIADIMGGQYASWLGAVNLVFPRFHYRGVDMTPTRRLMPEDIDKVRAAGGQPEGEILSLLAHRLNLPNSWRHIAPDTVKQLALRQELQRQREQASKNGDLNELIELYREENTRQEEQIRELKNVAEANNDQIREQDATIDQLEFDIENLKVSLQNSRQSAPVSTGGASDEVVDSFLCVANKSAPTPFQCLQLVSHFFPDALVITDSAWKSATTSASFKYGQKALGLLIKLATDYRKDLLEGKGDAVARMHFGNAYAAKESETVEQNKRAKQARTFTYKGRELQVSKHLRIGTKDSVAETLRIYFEWDAEDGKSVIFHCGQHPPQR
jgi:hypothetical protein